MIIIQIYLFHIFKMKVKARNKYIAINHSLFSEHWMLSIEFIVTLCYWQTDFVAKQRYKK